MTPALDPARSARRRLLVVGLVAIAAVLAVLVLSRWGDDDRSALDRAQQLVSRSAGFDTGLEAGATLARAAQHLEQAVDECRRDEGGRRCQALASALGLSQVLAVHVLDCSAPGRFEARERMASYLQRVDEVAFDAARVPSPPELPSCGG